MEALYDNGSEVDGDNGNVDDWDGSKNGNGLTLKQKLRSFALNLTLYVSSFSCIDFLVCGDLFIYLKVAIVKSLMSIFTE